MGDISNSTRTKRFRAVAGTVGGFGGALAVAASALAYIILGLSDEAPFLSAGAQPVRTAPTPPATPFATITSEVATPAQPTTDSTAALADPIDPPIPPADEVVSATPGPSAAASSLAPVAPPVAPASVAAASPTPAAAPPNTAPSAAVSAPAPPPTTTATSPPPPAVAAVALTGREQGLVDAMNVRRSAAGLAPLLVSGALTDVARMRSSDMLANSYFAHSSPSGQTWYSLLTSLGMSYSAGGENLAKVSGDTASSVGLAIEALMASPTHRANILNPAYRLVGVGGAVQGDTLTILTSVFTDR